MIIIFPIIINIAVTTIFIFHLLVVVFVEVVLELGAEAEHVVQIITTVDNHRNLLAIDSLTFVSKRITFVCIPFPTHLNEGRNTEVLWQVYLSERFMDSEIADS